jgi:hypothetical protein
MLRREFLGAAAFTMTGSAAGAAETRDIAQISNGVPTRQAGPVEVVYKTPHGQPNGLASGPNPGELWVQDRGTGRQVSLIRADDGSLIREITADAIGPSGLTMDDDGMMWASDTHGVMLVAFDAADGHTLAKYFVPGSCRVFEKVGDPGHRASTLGVAYPSESRAFGDNIKNNEGNDTGSGLGPGRVAPETTHFWSGTGPAGVISSGDLLIYSCLPARAIYAIHKKSWQVQSIWPTPGNRTLGLCWANRERSSFWCAEANLNMLFRFDALSGSILESIRLPDGGPVLHGCQIVGTHMYFTDDMGWMCRFRM